MLIAPAVKAGARKTTSSVPQPCQRSRTLVSSSSSEGAGRKPKGLRAMVSREGGRSAAGGRTIGEDVWL